MSLEHGFEIGRRVDDSQQSGEIQRFPVNSSGFRWIPAAALIVSARIRAKHEVTTCH